MPENRLAGETSPYLLQHAHNPVDWFPWGAEALTRARLLDRPIFLSIGYAACHWCHVMERESFEDATTAGILNANLVSIKVDREERPDLDAVYMDAVQALTGSGGWPMSLFLTPDGRPFFGGTYFPADRRGGLPAFRDVLAGVVDAWARRRDEVEQSASALAAHVARPLRLDGGAASDRSTLDAAVGRLEATFDPGNGGWGTAPKFPQPLALEILLRRAAAGDARAAPIVRRSLERMAAGGIHDHLGGGFARYSTDASWRVPHFEKMLYDNAQLARTYMLSWRLVGDPADLAVAVDTLDCMARDFRLPDGCFASSLDADTDGVEGATYTWTADGVRGALADAGLGDMFDLVADAYDVTEGGNWEGRTILRRAASDAELAARHDLAVTDVAARLERARAALLAERNRRPQPARDDKALAGWNGLAIAAFADAGAALTRADVPRSRRYLGLARDAAARFLEVGRDPNGGLRRSWKDGRALHAGTLEDYAGLAHGLLALYESTFEERWFTAARELVDAAFARFTDPAGGWFDTAADAEVLIARPRSLEDRALPSGNALLATVALRLEALTGIGRYGQAATAALGQVGSIPAAHPTAFAQWLIALDWQLGPVDEVAILGDPDDPRTLALLGVATSGWRPRQVIATANDPATSDVPLLQGRFALRGAPTAFVCRGFACRQPVTEPEALAALLAS